VFLYGHMIGAAAEIDDHLNPGRNMDTRTPQAVRIRGLTISPAAFGLARLAPPH
jgi:hypothetical protein